jgi:ABC-type dipeptide/oligopeptide/nickel transport system, ATPase component
LSADSHAHAAGDAVLRVRDLAVRFDSGRNVVHAVNGVSLELEAGGALGLVGESGSGKSVTSLAILRLLPRHTARVGGEVWFGGRDLIQLNDKDRCAVFVGRRSRSSRKTR